MPFETSSKHLFHCKGYQANEWARRVRADCGNKDRAAVVGLTSVEFQKGLSIVNLYISLDESTYGRTTRREDTRDQMDY
ncbi:unnamed protein product [Brassica oleracea var. botrytis]